jgi:hypothetical protein
MRSAACSELWGGSAGGSSVLAGGRSQEGIAHRRGGEPPAAAVVTTVVPHARPCDARQHLLELAEVDRRDSRDSCAARQQGPGGQRRVTGQPVSELRDELHAVLAGRGSAQRPAPGVRCTSLQPQPELHRRDEQCSRQPAGALWRGNQRRLLPSNRVSQPTRRAVAFGHGSTACIVLHPAGTTSRPTRRLPGSSRRSDPRELLGSGHPHVVADLAIAGDCGECLGRGARVSSRELPGRGQSYFVASFAVAGDRGEGGRRGARIVPGELLGRIKSAPGIFEHVCSGFRSEVAAWLGEFSLAASRCCQPSGRTPIQP